MIFFNVNLLSFFINIKVLLPFWKIRYVPTVCLKYTKTFVDELRTAKDRKYGIETHDVKGNWNGVIGELIRKVWFLTLLECLFLVPLHLCLLLKV